MAHFATYLLLGIFLLLVIAFIYSFLTKKNQRKTHFQSKVVNDTSYNIGGIEEKGNDSDKTVRQYLDRKDHGDAQPFNDEDFFEYQDKVKE